MMSGARDDGGSSMPGRTMSPVISVASLVLLRLFCVEPVVAVVLLEPRRSGSSRRRRLAGAKDLNAQPNPGCRIPRSGCVARNCTRHPIPSNDDRLLVVIAAAAVAVGKLDEDRRRARAVILKRVGERLRAQTAQSEPGRPIAFDQCEVLGVIAIRERGE